MEAGGGGGEGNPMHTTSSSSSSSLFNRRLDEVMVVVAAVVLVEKLMLSSKSFCLGTICLVLCVCVRVWGNRVGDDGGAWFSVQSLNTLVCCVLL